MSHVRQQIRDRIVSDLTGLPTTGSNVQKGNFYPPVETPAIQVVMGGEELDESRAMGKTYYRSASVLVTAITVGGDVDKTISDIFVDVEKSLANDRRLGGIAKDLRLFRIGEPEEMPGEERLQSQEMEFVVDYQTSANEPEVAL